MHPATSTLLYARDTSTHPPLEAVRNHPVTLPISTMSDTTTAAAVYLRTAPALLLELRRMSQEIEPVIIHKADQPTLTGTRATYRAHLAHKGYLVKQTLGSGSYSKVKMALDFTGMAKKVAVKIVNRQKAPRDYQDKFMLRELEIWPRLQHRHLVALHDWFQNTHWVFMVLEYVEGGDVLNYMQSTGAVSESTARNWTRQLVDAISYLHQLDITHRDLKLENLLLDSEHNIKLCDFSFIKGTSSRQLSETFCGSRSYTAPEILLGIPYDPKKADVWAIGVILYIFVTGVMPFDESKGKKHFLGEQRCLAFPWNKLRTVSASCKVLITLLFTWIYQDRPNIISVLQDRWFTSLPFDNHRSSCLTDDCEVQQLPDRSQSPT